MTDAKPNNWPPPTPPLPSNRHRLTLDRSPPQDSLSLKIELLPTHAFQHVVHFLTIAERAFQTCSDHVKKYILKLVIEGSREGGSCEMLEIVQSYTYGLMIGITAGRENEG